MRRPRHERSWSKKVLLDLGVKLHNRPPSTVQQMLLDDLRRTRKELDDLRAKPMTKTSTRTEHALIVMTGRTLDRLAHFTGRRAR